MKKAIFALKSPSFITKKSGPVIYIVQVERIILCNYIYNLDSSLNPSEGEEWNTNA